MRLKYNLLKHHPAKPGHSTALRPTVELPTSLGPLTFPTCGQHECHGIHKVLQHLTAIGGPTWPQPQPQPLTTAVLTLVWVGSWVEDDLPCSTIATLAAASSCQGGIPINTRKKRRNWAIWIGEIMIYQYLPLDFGWVFQLVQTNPWFYDFICHIGTAGWTPDTCDSPPVISAFAALNCCRREEISLPWTIVSVIRDSEAWSITGMSQSWASPNLCCLFPLGISVLWGMRQKNPPKTYRPARLFSAIHLGAPTLGVQFLSEVVQHA